MTIKRKDFQKAAALIHEFQLKLSEEAECSELRDALNLALLHMQKYYRALRSRLLTQDKNNGNILSGSVRGLSPMTPFKDAPDRFQWKWLNLDNPKLSGTLPADLHKDVTQLPLIIQAAKAGDNNTLMQLIDRDDGAVLELDGVGRTALFYAAHFGHLDTMQILLEQGAEVNATAHDGSTSVHRVCQDGNCEALRILIGYQADLNIQDVHGRAPIHWACANHNRKCLRLLLENDTSVGVRDKEGMSPSMWACRMDHIEHFELLSSVESPEVLEEDGFERDNNGRTWLHWSVRRTDPLECLTTLLTEDSACLRDDEGKTVMHIAADQGSLPAVKTILEIVGKSCLEHRDNDNRTPLILATMSGHGELINYLLAEGADLASVDNSGATAWDYARGRQLHYCMLILASYIRQRASDEGPDPNGTFHYNEEGTIFNGTFPSGMEDDHLGFTQLQINGDQGDDTRFHSNRPIPPPHPPPGPPTPRTPRGHTTPRPNTPNIQQDSGPPSTPRGYTLKRSPTTPIEGASDEILQAAGDRKNSLGSKRKRTNIESQREQEEMKVENLDMQPHSQHSHHGNGDASGADGEMASESQYLEHCGPHGNNTQGDQDVDNVSIGEMDVSDMASEGQVDLDHDGVSPTAPVQPPPQPQPRYQLAPPSPSAPSGGEQHYYPSYQPHPPKTPPYHAHSPGHLGPPGFPDPSELEELLQDIDKSDLDLSRSNLDHTPPPTPDVTSPTVKKPPPASPTPRTNQDTYDYHEDEDEDEDDHHGSLQSPPPNDATPMGEPRNGPLGGLQPVKVEEPIRTDTSPAPPLSSEVSPRSLSPLSGSPRYPGSQPPPPPVGAYGLPASMHHNQDGRVIPPAHLLPLDLPPHGPLKSRKKKKKRRERHSHLGQDPGQNVPPPRGYTSPVNPPNNYPSNSGRERSAPSGGSGEHQGSASAAGHRERSPQRVQGGGVPPTPKPRERSPAPRLGDQANKAGPQGHGQSIRLSSVKLKKRHVHEHEQRFPLDNQKKVKSGVGHRGSPAGVSSGGSSFLPTAPMCQSRAPPLPQAQPRSRLTRSGTEANLCMPDDDDHDDDYDDDDDRNEDDYDEDEDDDYDDGEDDDDDDVIAGRGLSDGSGSGHQRGQAPRGQSSGRGGRFSNGQAGSGSMGRGGSSRGSRETQGSGGLQRRRPQEPHLPSPRARSRPIPGKGGVTLLGQKQTPNSRLPSSY